MSLVSRLKAAGIMGMNRRNIAYIARWNRRRDYPTVDDKLRTKEICLEAKVPVPRTLAVVRQQYEIRRLREALADVSEFVVKPAHGAQGNGILVVERRGDQLIRSERVLDFSDLEYHVSEILSGGFSLGGQPDQAIVEERLHVHPALARVSHGGVPDIRVIVYRGVPVMAMARLPTRRSGGRANLHQGALGVGIDLATGRGVAAMASNRYLDVHPDTGQSVVGIEIPCFAKILESAVQVSDHVALRYIGVDVVVDAERGPVVLELNARPGLAIQIANRAGLVRRTDWVDRFEPEGRSAQERVAAAAAIAADCRGAA